MVQQDNTAGKSAAIEKTVSINRVAKVVKGGRRFSFSALAVVGDGQGEVGCGLGKANEVADAIKKGLESAKKGTYKISLHEHTIPHPVEAKFGSSKVLLMPASTGTGVKAGKSVRAVLEAVGVRDILTKVHGSNNPQNVVKATIEALKLLRTQDDYKRRLNRNVGGENE